MNSISRIRILTISIVLVLCVPLWAKRQEKTAEKPAAVSMAPAAKPGAAEMDRLKFYLGEWEYTETYPKSGFSPNGGEEHRSVHQQARAGREFADQHVPFARACRRF